MTFTFSDLDSFLKNVAFPEIKIPLLDGSIHEINTGNFGQPRFHEIPEDFYQRYTSNDASLIDGVSRVVNDMKRLTHFHAILEDLKKRGYDDVATTLNSDCESILRKYVKRKKIQKKSSLTYRGLAFYSCCPKTRLRVSEGEVMKMSKFCEKVFSKKWFSDVKWILESGKHKDKPNLHFHALARFRSKSAAGNWRSRVLIPEWNKQYPDNPLDWKRGQDKGIDVVHCNTGQIQKDKYNYLENDSKGSHENFTDLKIGGEFGNVCIEWE